MHDTKVNQSYLYWHSTVQTIWSQMPCLRFNKAINVSFVEFGEVLKSSCTFEFLTHRASSNFEREGGNKAMTRTNFCKSPSSRSVPDTSHIWPWKSHRSEDNTRFYKTEKCDQCKNVQHLNIIIRCVWVCRHEFDRFSHISSCNWRFPKIKIHVIFFKE